MSQKVSSLSYFIYSSSALFEITTTIIASIQNHYPAQTGGEFGFNETVQLSGFVDPSTRSQTLASHVLLVRHILGTSQGRGTLQDFVSSQDKAMSQDFGNNVISSHRSWMVVFQKKKSCNTLAPCISVQRQMS